jgi:hypothetical protein
MRSLAALLFLLTSCSTAAESTMHGPKRPHQEVPFSRGPALAPTEELLPWLEAQMKEDGSARVVRLPFELKQGINSIASARLGVGAASLLDVDIDDSAMNVSLADRVRHACPDPAVPCAAWLEGYWRSSGEGYRFDATRFVRSIPAEELADANYAEVAAP